MTTDQIITVVVALVGSGVLGALVNSLATRKKVHAESGKILAESKAIDQDSLHKAVESIARAADLIADISGQQVQMLCDQVGRQDKRIADLEKEIRILREKSTADDVTIDTLKRENGRLKEQLKKLVDENKTKDLVIDDLKRRVLDLESRLSAVQDLQRDGDCGQA